MEKTSHVMLIGDGAEKFADSCANITRVKNDYFHTERRKEQWDAAKQGLAPTFLCLSMAENQVQLDHSKSNRGTVGCGRFIIQEIIIFLTCKFAVTYMETLPLQPVTYTLTCLLY